ncbi:MAG: hypothetical protein ACFHXK_01535 [bacterium]
MIITFEGAPAVGKTTVAKRLASEHGYVRIPEVNELFPERPSPEPEYWYCERQLDRCQTALKYENSILDGDPFQAVWFSWIYPNRGFADWSTSLRYFIANAHRITLPSCYVYLCIEPDERFRREKEREYARGPTYEQFLNKWNLYADFQGPQQALFDAIKGKFPGWIHTTMTRKSGETVAELASLAPATAPAVDMYLSWLSDWLKDNNSDDFR